MMNFCILPVTVIGNSSTKTDMPRHLVVRDLVLAERFHVLCRQGFTGARILIQAQSSSP